MTDYVVFLRGINVGGAKKVEMARLRILLTSLGFSEVSTRLNSGNVVFSAAETDAKKLASRIEAAFEETFGFHSAAIIRTAAALKELVASQPFAGIDVTPNTRLYVSFLAEELASALPLPYRSPGGEFRILLVTATEVVSVLTLSEKKGTTDAMQLLEKEFGKQITTRNWNTIIKLAASS